jgi:hypothetical protein
MNPIYIFYHVVKTGGTTIGNHCFKHLQEKYIDKNKSQDSNNETVFIQGHVHNLRGSERGKHPGRKVREFTVLRDPAEWLVSIYHHDTTRSGSEISFEEWYQRTPPDRVYPMTYKYNRFFWYLCWFFRVKTIEQVKKRLDTFFFVGLIKKLNQDLPKLFLEMGIPETFDHARKAGTYDPCDKKVLRNNYTLTKKMREKIRNQNPLDYELYDYGIKLNRKGLNYEL